MKLGPNKKCRIIDCQAFCALKILGLNLSCDLLHKSQVYDCQSTNSCNYQGLLANIQTKKNLLCIITRNKFSHRYKFWNDDPDVSLRFKIQDGRNSEMEPAYTETKASILR